VHFMVDTEDADAADEIYWPEGFKEVLRSDFYNLAVAELKQGKTIQRIYEKRYSDAYQSLDAFVDKLATMLVIGTENGADDMFDEINASLTIEEPSLPDPRRHVRHFWPTSLFETEVETDISKSILEEYRKEEVYRSFFERHSMDEFPAFDNFIREISILVTAGAMNGCDDILGKIWRSFVIPQSLPPARRHPKRLKI